MEWTKYTTKEALKDNDELMILDKDANANKRTLMDKVWDYVVDKMTTAVIAKLRTTNKTLIGAVNELNSNLKICDSLYSRGVQNIGNNKTTISISLTSEDQSIFVAFCGTKGSYFISLVRGVYNGELLATNISKSDDCYATAGNLKNTIEIHTGSWGRGILLSYAPFTVSTK